MKVSYNWLKNYLPFTYSPQELGDMLTQTGLEVEGIEPISEIQGNLTGVVIGEVLSCEQHPDADKLKVTTVSIGSADPLQIVCGAPNVAKGQKVVVATVGTKLYPQVDQVFEIKKAKIRGVVSEGMLCAEDELGLGQSHDGIMVLPSSTPVGLRASDFFKLENDFQLEIGLTPNRSDALGHIGVARDIRAVHNLRHQEKIDLNWPLFPLLNNTDLPALDIAVLDKIGCKKYFGLQINQVKVGPSPKWLQNRLKAVGLKPINNIVDISNFVQRELGTPLHIFDADQSGTALKIRCANPQEKFTGLDGHVYTLDGHELVIANSKEVLCLAGILGGSNSGVSEQTTNILIESALFDPIRIRKAARQHGLNTDASFRFERGVDPNQTQNALLRCAALIIEIAGGQAQSSTFEWINETLPPVKIELSKNELNKLIGNELAFDTVEQILKDLDFKINAYSNDTWQLEAPSYRIDVTRAVDVIEEIVRIYGLNSIEMPRKWQFSLGAQNPLDSEIQKSNISAFLVGRGYYETLNNSLTKNAYNALLDHTFGKPVKILNPLSQDLGSLRQTLLFGLLENTLHNKNRQISQVQLFEFGQSYRLEGSTYGESQKMALLIYGKDQSENWNTQAQPYNFFSLKKEVLALLERFGIQTPLETENKHSILFEQGQALYQNETLLVDYGQISSKIQTEFDLKQPVYFAEFDWNALCKAQQKHQIKFEEVAKTFAVRRDLSLLIDQSTAYESLVSAARNAERKLLQDVQLFDVYEGKNLPAGKKSYALSFFLQDKTQTLSESQIDKAMQRILSALEKDCAATLRQ